MKRVLLALALAVPSSAAAQNCQTAAAPANCTLAAMNTPATMTNPKTILLTLSTITTTGTTAIADFDNTYMPLTGPVVTVNANRAWTLLIHSAATWSNVGPISRVGKPASELRWSTAVGGPFVGLTTVATQYANGAATNSTVRSIFYRAVLDWTLDKPGVYTIAVTFTVTTP